MSAMILPARFDAARAGGAPAPVWLPETAGCNSPVRGSRMTGHDSSRQAQVGPAATPRIRPPVIIASRAAVNSSSYCADMQNAKRFTNAARGSDIGIALR